MILFFLLSSPILVQSAPFSDASLLYKGTMIDPGFAGVRV